jgi:hypothetical protein
MNEATEETEEYEVELQKLNAVQETIDIMKKYYDARVNRYRACSLGEEVTEAIATCWTHFYECMADCERNEEYAVIHMNGLLHLLHDPIYALPELSNPEENYMQWYLNMAYEMAKSFILGCTTLVEAKNGYDRLFAHYVAINNKIDYHWSEMTKHVSPIHQDSEQHIEVNNPNYVAPPEDFLEYLQYIKQQSEQKRKKEEQEKMKVKVVYSVPNDNFRLVQMYYFYEFKCLFDFTEKIDAMVSPADRHLANEVNNVGWIASLLYDQQSYVIVDAIRQKIYYGYILPGNTREMQLSIETPLRQLKPRDILYQIGSPIYYEHISPFFKYNIGLLWDDLKNKSAADTDLTSFVWDVRENIILHFFYFLHLKQKGIVRNAIDIAQRIFLVSIYTLRYESFTLEDKDGYLIGFRRKWYLFQKDKVSCYEGHHAMENALYAWSCYVYGRDNAFTNIVGMVEEQALPDANLTMENVVTLGTYASTVMENSIFIK